MKKSIVALLSCLFASVFAYAQSSVQILMPRNAYTGDRCELRYVFSTETRLVYDGNSPGSSGTVELDIDSPAFKREADKCMVYRVSLEHSGSEHTLTLYFIPWHPGDIDFAPFDLALMVRKAQKIDSPGEPFIVDLAPVSVGALAEKLGVMSMMPSSGPMVLPGTVFILAALAVALLAVLAVVVFAIIKAPAIIASFAAARGQRRLKRLLSRTKRLLRRLLRAEPDDEAFCQSLSSIIRSYLCGRFTDDFSALTTGKFFRKFEELCCGSVPGQIESSVMDIMEILQRCDYVRFAKGSIDSRRQPAALHEAALGEGENNLLVSRCIDALTVLGTFTMKDGEDM